MALDPINMKIAAKKAEMILIILNELKKTTQVLHAFADDSGNLTKFNAIYENLENIQNIVDNLQNLLKTQQFRNEAETFANNAKLSKDNAKLSQNASKESEIKSKINETHSANSEVNALTYKQQIEKIKSAIDTTNSNIANMQTNITIIQHDVQTKQQKINTQYQSILNEYANIIVPKTVTDSVKTWSSQSIAENIEALDVALKALIETKFNQLSGVDNTVLQTLQQLQNEDTSLVSLIGTKLDKTATATNSEKLGNIPASNYLTEDEASGIYATIGNSYTKEETDINFLKLEGGWIVGQLKISGGLLLASRQGLSFSDSGRMYKPDANTFYLQGNTLQTDKINALDTIVATKSIKANEGFYWGKQSLDVRYVKKADTSWKSLALLNGWELESSCVASFKKTSEDVVYLKGMVKAGIIGTQIAQLPDGYRPDRDMSFIVRLDNDYGKLDINTYGYVTISAIDGSTNESAYVSLEVCYGI